MYILITGNWGNTAVFLTILNHKIAIRSVETRGGPGGDQTWVALVRDWTNRWHWHVQKVECHLQQLRESYGCDTCISFQDGYGDIQRGSTDNDFELRITSWDYQQVICTGLYAKDAGNVMSCKDADGNGLQFDDMSDDVDVDPCDGSDIYTPPGGGNGGVSPGGKAALVIFLLILPVGCAAACIGWVVYRKHKQEPIIPEKVQPMVDKVKSLVHK